MVGDHPAGIGDRVEANQFGGDGVHDVGADRGGEGRRRGRNRLRGRGGAPADDGGGGAGGGGGRRGGGNRLRGRAGHLADDARGASGEQGDSGDRHEDSLDAHMATGDGEVRKKYTFRWQGQ